MNYQYIATGSAALSVILAFSFIWLYLRVSRIDRLRKELFLGEGNKKIDDAIIEHHQDIAQLNEKLQELGAYTAALAQANKKNLQKVGFVRFNPFGDAGGAISFVVAVLNAENTGYVISSLHGREGNRIYAKEIVKGTSKSPLTEEEKEAIKRVE